MKTKIIYLVFLLFVCLSCDDKKKYDQNGNRLSTTKRILSKLHLIDLDESVIQREKIKEAYDLLNILEINKKSIDTVAKNQIFKIFNNDSLAKSFMYDEIKYVNAGFKLDSITIVNDTILVSLRKKQNSLARKFLYKLVKDSIIDKNLPPTVFFKILDSKYESVRIDSIGQ
jgi:hypothetical protein